MSAAEELAARHEGAFAFKLPNALRLQIFRRYGNRWGRVYEFKDGSRCYVPWGSVEVTVTH